jgi:hypothetical protein
MARGGPLRGDENRQSATKVNSTQDLIEHLPLKNHRKRSHPVVEAKGQAIYEHGQFLHRKTGSQKSDGT